MREMGANRRSHRLGGHRRSRTKDASGGSSARSLSTAENCQPRRGSGRASLRMMHDDGGHKWLREPIKSGRWMARLADQEMSTAQIAKALGLTRGQVLGKMHRLGLKTKNPPRKLLTTALVEKLTELTDQRLSASQIGQALGLTRPQVIYRMRHLGLKMNPKTEWPAGQAEKIPELINQGLSHGGIAKALGLTRGQVLGKMRRLGLKTKNAANPKKGRRRKVAYLESEAS
jgi:hypothetical protein